MDPSTPTVSITLWRADAIVFFDWLMSADLDQVPADHKAVKQALADLLGRIETDTDVPYGELGAGLTQEEIDEARSQVSADMGW